MDEYTNIYTKHPGPNAGSPSSFGDAPDWEEIVGGLSILKERIQEALS
jgi:hypothetical protein